jgi:fibronectin-binding autotransporter adhesin
MQFDSSVSGNAFTFGGLKGNKNLALRNNAGTPAPITLSVGANGQSTSYSGILSDAGGLTKIGSGTFTLTNAQTYTGATAIDAGMLQVNGSLSASSAVTVASAATLAGSGTIGGPVAVLGGGIVAPGTSPGTLTMDAGLSLEAASLLAFELSPTTFTVGGGINDLVVVSGDFTLDGLLDVAAIGGGDFSAVPDNTSWRLFNYAGGTFTNNGLSLNSLPSPGAGRSFQIDTSTAGQVNLVVVVPEPGTAVGAGIGIMVAARFLARRRVA